MAKALEIPTFTIFSPTVPKRGLEYIRKSKYQHFCSR